MPETEPYENGDTLDHLDVRPLTWASEVDSLADVARALRESGSSCAVLAEPPLRIVTERDLVAAWADGRSSTDKIACIAGGHEQAIARGAPIMEVATRMVQHGSRDLVVIDAERPVGVISMVELFASLLGTEEPETSYAEYAALVLHSTPQ
jgi:signal-transduction protein with cAMP-binding, CBS, and nucleotidyltransferase domain